MNRLTATHKWTVDLTQPPSRITDVQLGTVRCDARGIPFVVDRTNAIVYQLHPDGFVEQAIGLVRPAECILKHPVDIAFDSRNDLFIADIETRHIYMYSTSGQYIAKIPVREVPYSIVIDSKTTVYIHDPTPEGIIHVYNERGIKQNMWAASLNLPNENAFIASGFAETIPGHVHNRGVLARDNTDTIYFAWMHFYEILKYNARGECIGSIQGIRKPLQKVSFDVRGRKLYEVIIFDISMGDGYLYVLYGPQKERKAIIDVFLGNGEYVDNILLSQPAHSISFDGKGSVYTAYSNITKKAAQVSKYVIA